MCVCVIEKEIERKKVNGRFYFLFVIARSKGSKLGKTAGGSKYHIYHVTFRMQIDQPRSQNEKFNEAAVDFEPNLSNFHQLR